MSGIFVCYRRGDSPNSAGRLYDHLRNRFGASRVFRDLDTLEPGVSWAEAVERFIRSCDAVVVVIGNNWLAVRADTGQRRLDDPADPVRREIVAALDEQKLIIPVLVDDARMPVADDMPIPVRFLAGLHALAISDSRWEFDVGLLIARLEAAIPEGPAARASRLHSRRLLAVAVTATALLVSGLTLLGLVRNGNNSPTTPVGRGTVLCQGGERFSLEILRPAEIAPHVLRVPVVLRNISEEPQMILGSHLTVSDQNGRQLEGLDDEWSTPFTLDPGSFYEGYVTLKIDGAREVKIVTIRTTPNGSCDSMAASAKL